MWKVNAGRGQGVMMDLEMNEENMVSKESCADDRREKQRLAGAEPGSFQCVEMQGLGAGV